MLTPIEAGQTAFALNQGLATGENFQTAFVAHGDEIYFARHRVDGPAPMSALVKLIQGIYEQRPERALAILRGRIFLSYEATPLCWGMMKVTARRLTSSVEPCDHGVELRRHFVEMPELSVESRAAQRAELAPISDALAEAGARVDYPDAAAGPAGPALPASNSNDDEHFMKLARRLAAAIPRAQTRRFDRDRAIATLLVSAEGELLAAGVNTITRNRTFHAELNAVQTYWRQTGRPLPAGTRVYTTLKSCRMCAGALWQACEEPGTLRVRYAENDPGPNARHTIFEAGGSSLEERLTLGL